MQRALQSTLNHTFPIFPPVRWLYLINSQHQLPRLLATQTINDLTEQYIIQRHYFEHSTFERKCTGSNKISA